MLIKSNWKVWLGIIAVLFFGQLLGQFFIQKEEEKKNHTIFVSSDFIHPEGQFSVGNDTFTFVKDPSADFVITETDKTGELYIPLVLFANSNLLHSDQTYFAKRNETSFQKDIRLILEDIEQGKTWREAGLSDASLVGDVDQLVTLQIPDVYDPYYDAVREYIILAFNQFQQPDSKQRESLEQRADRILEQCVPTENLAYDICHDLMGIAIYPEYILTDTCVEISPGTVYACYYQVTFSDKSDINSSVLQSSEFLDATGLRSVQGNSGESRCFSISNFQRISSSQDDDSLSEDLTESVDGLEKPEKMEENVEEEVEETETETEAGEEETDSDLFYIIFSILLISLLIPLFFS